MEINDYTIELILTAVQMAVLFYVIIALIRTLFRR